MFCMYNGLVLLHYISSFPRLILHNTQPHLCTDKAKEVYSDLYKYSCKNHVSLLYLSFLKLSFVIKKFLYFQDHHPTGSNHISNEYENM